MLAQNVHKLQRAQRVSCYRLLSIAAVLTLGPLCLGISGSPVAAAPRGLSPSDRADLSDACVIAYWTFDNAIADTAAPPPSSGSGAASIGIGSTAAVVLPAFPWISRAWSLTGWDGGSLAGAEAGNDYVEFDASTMGAIDVTFGFTLRYAGSIDKLLQLEYSVDRGTTFLPYGGQITVPASSWNHWTYNNANFAGKPSLKVRLYGWSGTLGFLIDDVVLGKSCLSPTPTATPSAAITDTPVPSATSTETPTPSATPADTGTPLATVTDTPTPSATPEDTATPLATATETLTPTVSPTAGSARMVFLPAAIR